MLKNDELSQRKTYDILDTIPNGIAIIEVNPKHIEDSLRVIYYNDYLYRYSGYTREECEVMLQKDAMSLVFEEDTFLLLTDIMTVCSKEEGSFARSMVRCHTKDGSCHWILFNGLLVEKHEDACVFHIAMIDITELGGKSENNEAGSGTGELQEKKAVTGTQAVTNVTGTKTSGTKKLKTKIRDEKTDKSEDEAQGKGSITGEAETIEPRYRTKRRILIVDDNSTTRLLLIKTLSEDYVIETAKDGVEAMSRLWYFGSTISAVLLDLFMPGVGGFEILQKMQTNIDLRKIPVIIVSSDDDRDTIRKAMEYGAVDFITKPVDTELLQLRLKSTIDRTEKELQWVE